MEIFKTLFILSTSGLILYLCIKRSYEKQMLQLPNVLFKHSLREYFTCPYLPPASYDSSFEINNARIAIIMAFSKLSDYDEYVYAVNATQCYAKHFGYQMHFINLFDKKIGNQCNHTNLYFKRHCALAWFMDYYQRQIDYVLYLDADMGVVNPCHTIQEYLVKDERVHLTFYERYFNLEFAAGSYLVRNTEQSRNFLHFWADYLYRMPTSCNGNDNGAIHQVLMELHFADKRDQMQCYDFWKNAKNDTDLNRFNACVKNALFKNSSLLVNNTVKIICKMDHGWVRDAWLTKSKWSPKDFMFHGMKKSLYGTRWQGPFVDNFNLDFCEHRSLTFPNFKYIPVLQTTDDETKTIVLQTVNAVNEKYLTIMKKLVNNTLNPKYGRCS